MYYSRGGVFYQTKHRVSASVMSVVLLRHNVGPSSAIQRLTQVPQCTKTNVYKILVTHGLNFSTIQ